MTKPPWVPAPVSRWNAIFKKAGETLEHADEKESESGYKCPRDREFPILLNARIMDAVMKYHQSILIHNNLSLQTIANALYNPQQSDNKLQELINKAKTKVAAKELLGGYDEQMPNN